jgi:hypothetical protein
MRRVIVESPYAGDTETNIRYAQDALLDSLQRGEAPFASHLLYTQVLADKGAARDLGIKAGVVWGLVANAAVFYTDLGWSPGMLTARDFYGRPRTLVTVEERSLPAWRK